MGGFLNQLSAPLGIKLFSGGPYADNGAGDQMQKTNDQQMLLAQQYAKQLGPIIAEIAKNAGVTNPQTGEKGTFSDNLYGLSGVQQGNVNQQAGVDTEAYDNIMHKVRANLSARGMLNPSMETAASAYLQKKLQSQIGQERIQAGQNAYNSRVGAMDQIAQLLSSGNQAQQGVLQQRQNVFAQQGQTAELAHQQAMQNLGQTLGLGAYLGGVSPFGPQGNVNRGNTDWLGPFGGSSPYPSGIQGQIEGAVAHPNYPNITLGGIGGGLGPTTSYDNGRPIPSYWGSIFK